MSVRRLEWVVVTAWLTLDQTTKLLVARRLEEPVVLIDGFVQLVSRRNPGALFGLMADWSPAWRLVVLTVLPSLAIIGLIVLLTRTPRAEIRVRVGLCLILGGAIGNVADRIARGYVIDFIDVHWAGEPVSGWLTRAFGTSHWPTFNVADVGLTCGAMLLAAQMIVRRRTNEDESAPLPD